MLTVDEISRELARIAPLALAESWDNVGLLVGDRARPAARVMTCLTLTPPVVEEAVAENADLVVVHHPLPFRPVSQITSDSTVGAMLWRLIGAQVAVYSAHTAFDSAREGINARWAAALDLSNVAPLVPPPEAVELPGPLGAGRRGRLSAPLSLDEVAARIKQFLGIARVRIVDAGRARVDEIAIACGSGGSFIPAAVKASCNCLITGEATFHNCLEAAASALALILVGHYPSERFAMEELAAELGDRFPEIACWASRTERDPLRTS